jgi:hypothetical protein
MAALNTPNMPNIISGTNPMSTLNPIATTNNPNWLSQLAPAHAPPALGWWPLAPGWWVLLALLIIAIAVALYLYFQPQRRMRRLALRELKRLADNTDEPHLLARDLEHLMRRFAMMRFGREQIALLSGDAWIAFVVAHGGKEFAGASGTNLLRLAFGGQATADSALWLAGARAFFKDKS